MPKGGARQAGRIILEDCIAVDHGAEADVRTTRNQIPNIEIMDLKSTSYDLGAQEENSSARICAAQIAQAALLELDNFPGGFIDKPDQSHQTEAMSHPASHGAKQFQDVSGSVYSHGLPQPTPQRTASDILPENLPSTPPSSNRQRSEYHPLANSVHVGPSQPSPADSISASHPRSLDTMNTDNGVKVTYRRWMSELSGIYSQGMLESSLNARVETKSTMPEY